MLSGGGGDSGAEWAGSGGNGEETRSAGRCGSSSAGGIARRIKGGYSGMGTGQYPLLRRGRCAFAATVPAPGRARHSDASLGIAT